MICIVEWYFLFFSWIILGKGLRLECKWIIAMLVVSLCLSAISLSFFVNIFEHEYTCQTLLHLAVLEYPLLESFVF